MKTGIVAETMVLTEADASATPNDCDRLPMPIPMTPSAVTFGRAESGIRWRPRAKRKRQGAATETRSAVNAIGGGEASPSLVIGIERTQITASTSKIRRATRGER